MTFVCVCVWPYSRVRSRYCPNGLVIRAGRDMRGASPPLDWPIRLLLRRDTVSMGLCRRWVEGGGWRVEWKVEGQVGWREGQEVEECFTSTLSNDRKHLDTSTRLNPSPPRPSLWTNHFQSRRSATTPIDHWQTCVKFSQSEAPTCQSFAPNECECFCCDSVVTDSTWVCGWEVVKVITVKSSTDALSGYRDPPYTWL